MASLLRWACLMGCSQPGLLVFVHYEMTRSNTQPLRSISPFGVVGETVMSRPRAHRQFSAWHSILLQHRWGSGFATNLRLTQRKTSKRSNYPVDHCRRIMLPSYLGTHFDQPEILHDIVSARAAATTHAHHRGTEALVSHNGAMALCERQTI